MKIGLQIKVGLFGQGSGYKNWSTNLNWFIIHGVITKITPGRYNY